MNNRYGDRQGRDERGFMDRAGDEVRSWFGDDEAERRREQDERRWERERGMTGRRDNQPGDNSAGYMGTGGGWGNQTADSWNRERPGVSYGSDRHGSSSGWGSEHSSGDWGSGRGGRERSGSSWNYEGGRGRDEEYGQDRQRSASGNSSRDDDRFGDRQEQEDRFSGSAAGGYSSSNQEIFGETYSGGTSGFGGGPDHGRRFDRIDPGHTGTQGVHPMSSPVGGAYGGAYGAPYGGGAMGGSSASRYARMARGQQQSGSQQTGGQMQGQSGGGYDPHYHEWRSRQIESLDRDYDDYRREHQSRFEQDFGDWRTRRGEQRQALSRVSENMEVVGSDGQRIGTVDKVRGDRIILNRKDENAGGVHHSIPCSWIDRVEDRVTVNKSREEAMRQWRDEDRSRALFEREDSGSTGPHMLNRSFSGTYDDDE